MLLRCRQSYAGIIRCIFDTFYMSGDSLFHKILGYLSPVTMYINHMTVFYENEQNSISVLLENWFMLAAVIVIAAVLLAAALWLYKKRPSEAALHSMVFPKSKPVIKVLLLTVLSAACGLFLRAWQWRRWISGWRSASYSEPSFSIVLWK